jgi:acyl transferase domain-containing protein/acyl carrier protein
VNPAEFWQILRSGTEAVTVFSDDELAAAGVPRSLRDDPDYVPSAGVVAGSDLFDAGLFGINPKEATLMDPQHRVMLECAWEALEDSGHDPRNIAVRVGVFAGSYKNDYLKLLGPHTGSSQQFLAGVSNDADYLATRISFKLDLTGPSVSVQTACSTALVSAHLAAESLRSGSCDLAIAGGVTIRSGQHPGYLFHKGGIYSPDGHCRAFDAGAEGTVIGEGAGLVVLKRLADALADGDRIRAVIKGSAAGNDGADRVGFSAPGVAGQARIVRAALENAKVEPDSIGYLETHGSGTPLGDRIEIDALTRAFQAAGWSSGTCAIGSVKTNIGHTHAAAGIAGLIKTILTLENQEIAPSLHFVEPNPRIDFAGSPFRVNAELTPWQAHGAPRRAGVSSFGMGGTGVHMVLEEAPCQVRAQQADRVRVLPLSANVAAALAPATERLADHLEQHPDIGLAEVARTLQAGRHAFGHRRVLVARDREDAVEALRSPQRLLTLSSSGIERRVALLLPGLGEQHENMGQELYESEPVFRRELDRCLEIFRDRAGVDLRPVLYPPDRPRGTGAAKPNLRAMLGRTAKSTLDETHYAQPTVFANEYALAQLWLSRGVRPDALIGYSLGEYVVATLAGVFSLRDALLLVAERARMINELPGGAMLAVQLPEDTVAGLLDVELSIAAVNGSDLCVVAGPETAVAALEARLTGDGGVSRRLRTTHAFHSAMMQPIVESFTKLVSSVPRNRPAIPYLSNVTGDWITDAEATDPGYYARHLREAVRFGDGVRKLWQQPGRILLEVGVGQPLGSMAQQVRPRDADAGSLVLGSLPGANDGGSDVVSIATTTAKLWLCGVDVDWDSVQPERGRVSLPTYPFQRRRCWPVTEHVTEVPVSVHDGRQKLADWFYTPQWESLPHSPRHAEPAEPSRWLIFADEVGVAGSLTALLAERGDSVTLVWRGSDFVSEGDGSYRIDPANTEHYVELLRRIEVLPTKIAHLWLVTEGPAGIEQATRDGFASLVALAQAIGRESLTGTIEVSVVSSEMHDLADGDQSQPAKALALGPCRVWPLENPAITCRSVDINVTTSAERLLSQLDRPVRDSTGVEVTALRGRLRLRQTFQPVRLENPSGEFRTGGTYLITGGLGGIGLSLAEHLASNYQANLVLLSRSGADSDERVESVQRLRQAGGTVMVAAVDVTDADRLSAVVHEAVERFGAIHGVVHAAGVPGGGLIQLKDAGAAAKVLAPKVRGALALRDACESLTLDFLVHCSSGIAVSGGIGQVDYCAANSFLDALAHHDESAGRRPVVSVNWDAWQAVGMAAKNIGGARPAGRDVRHPLLERRLAGTSERYSIYVTHFGAKDSWLVDEHRMNGRPVVPGVGHLELVRAAFADDSGEADRIELTDVTFYTPIVVPEDGRRQVRVVLERDRNGTGFAVISSHEDRWQLHSSGRVAPLGDEQPRRLDIRALTSELSDIGRPQTDGPMGFGSRSQCLQQMYVGDEFLARLELPPQFKSEVEQLELHPALMDISTAFVGVHHAREFRIPISYGRLVMFAPLQAAIYSHQSYRDGDQAGKETVTSDVSITDLDGNELVRAERFVLKRVHDLDERLTAAQSASEGTTKLYDHPPVHDSERAEPSAGFLRTALDYGMSPEEGTEVLARILTAGLTPQVLVSTRELSTVLDQVSQARAVAVPADGGPRAAIGSAHPRPDLLTAYEAPRDSVEQQLAELWQELLGVEKVGVHDHFFELGGHSLLGLQLVPRLRETFAVDLPVGTIFDAPTVANLASALRSR